MAPIGFLPDPPKEFTKAQQTVWIDIIKTLAAANALNEVGLPLIYSYCVQYGMFEDALNQVRIKGIVIIQKTKKGDIIKQNPAVQVMNASNSLMLSLSKEFGFSPLSQSKINTKPVEPEKKKSKFDI
jgi:P27 family predicted phage terminase small subunit